MTLGCSSNKKIAGTWTEKWVGVGEGNPVTYVDTIQINLSLKNSRKLSCLNNRNYIYRDISFKDRKLNFKMENIVDAEEKFFVYYKLVLREGNKLFQGTILNSKNQTDSVIFEKIK